MLQNNFSTTVQTISGNDVILRSLGQKMNRGEELNSPERIMAISAATAEQGNQYGPGPDTFQVKPIDLPESTKGVLADYAG